MKQIGVHIRLNSTLTGVAQRALDLGIPLFQCFLLNQETGKFFKPKLDDQISFLALRDQFDQIFLHTSYWINMASTVYETHRILNREIEWAKRLQFSGVVIHPGSAKASGSKELGIQAVARVLNKKVKDIDGVKIILENTAHGGLSIGSDLNDFAILLAMLDQPEKIWFCLDTAHAYSYGYDLADDKGQEEFLALVGNTIGFERIALIHLNDTTKQLGSQVDQHSVPGRGHIGARKLVRFVNDPRLTRIPLIIELPKMDEEKEDVIIKDVRGWFKEK